MGAATIAPRIAFKSSFILFSNEGGLSPSRCLVSASDSVNFLVSELLELNVPLAPDKLAGLCKVQILLFYTFRQFLL